MPDQAVLAPGMRVMCRDSEWIVNRVQPADSLGKHQAIQCTGTDELVRGHEAVFLTQLDSLEPVDPRQTVLREDKSPGFKLARLFNSPIETIFTDEE